MSYSEIGRILGKDRSDVRRKLARNPDRASLITDWTADEDEILRLEYGRVTIVSLSERLDRSPHAIRRRASRLGLTQGPKPSQFVQPWQLGPVLGDDGYVSACLAQGGFPAALVLEGRTVWIDAHGKPWRRAA